MHRMFLPAVLLIMPAAAQTVVPIENTLRSTATAGQEVVVHRYASWSGSTCAAHAPPQVALRSQPQHGTVVVRPGTSTVREVREGRSQACLGMTMPGTVVAYTAAPGFRGMDGFDYTVTSINGAYHDTVVVEVR